MLKLLVTHENKLYDLSQMIASVEWSGEYRQCTRILEVNLVSTPDDANLPKVTCELGDAVTFSLDGKELFQGYIFSRQKGTGDSAISIRCYDRGYYLNRNKASFKFTNETPDAIARKICVEFEVPVGQLVQPGVTVSRIFSGCSLYEMIQTAYTLAAAKTKKQYFIRFSGGKLNVLEKSADGNKLVIEGGANLLQASCSESIENMINKISIRDENDKETEQVSNDQYIKLYGLMQDYLSQSKDGNAKEKAEKLLAENGVSQKVTLDCLGDVNSLTGDAVIVKEPYTGLSGLFYIESDLHTWKDGVYKNQLVVNFQSMMDEVEAGSKPEDKK